MTGVTEKGEKNENKAAGEFSPLLFALGKTLVTPLGLCFYPKRLDKTLISISISILAHLKVSRPDGFVFFLFFFRAEVCYNKEDSR